MIPTCVLLDERLNKVLRKEHVMKKGDLSRVINVALEQYLKREWEKSH